MYSFRYLAKLSLFLGFCILIVEIRPSSAMPIEGDKNTDKYSAVFDLIAHRLRNLSDVNQDNDQNFRKSFVPERNVTSTVNETLVAQNTSNLNNVTVLSLNGTQKNQSNDQNSRRSYVPMPTGYVGSLLAGNLPADNQMAGNLPARNQVAGNSPSGNQMAGNYPRSQMGSNLPAANQMAENLPAGSQMAGNYPRSQMGGDLLAANQMAGNTATSQIAGYSPAATQLAENSPKSQVAGNLTTISTLAATQMAGNPSRSQMAGNVPVENKMAVNSARSHMASNTPAANQMTGNPPSSQMAGYQSGANQLAGNLPRIQVAGNLPASNTPAVNQMAGNPPKSQIAGYSPIATQRARNFPVTNTPMENQLVRTPNQLAKNPLPFRSNDTKPASNVVSMFPASYNDGPISHEDKSGLYTSLYRQPPSYDRKNTIYRQTSSTPSYYRNVNNYGNISPSSSNIRRSWVKTPGQYTGSYQNYPQQMGHSAPNYQQYYTFPGYPYQQQQWRGGYQGSPGYQVNYPGTSQQSSNGGTKEANDSNLENWDKKFSVPGKFKDSGSYKHDHIPSQKPSTIQRKLAEKPVRKSFSPTTSLSEDSAPSSGISSGSGSGFNEPEDMYPDMEDTSDIQESRALSGSGNDDDIDDENEDLNGDTSNVAFMLAGTNNERNQPPSPSFPVPVPGLPMNLTRKQAIDIYKSALYFAGLLREDNIDNNAAGSGADDIDGDDKIDPKFAAEDDVDADDDVTLTDNDVKEALAASSGELDASGQQASDVDASDSQSVAVVVKPLNKDNAGAVTGDSAPQTTESVTQKVASEPQQEVTQVPSQDNTSQKDDSEAINEKEDALKELGQPDQDGTVEEINAEPVAPTDSEKQASDTTEQANDDNNKEQDDTNEQEDLDSPPPDETKQVSEAQSRYAADQQREKALSYLANTRQRGVFTSASQRTFICKDTTQRISCPPQQRIRILNADYGDTGNVGCLKEANPMPAGMCRTPGAYETVKRHCDGLEDCDLYASNDVFGDVCPDANKYLEVNHDCVNNPVPYAPAPAPGYNQASYQAAPQYVNPPPPPVAYAPAPYQAPPPQAYAPALPNLLPPSPYAAPDPCSPCNTCAQCSLPVCSPCTQTCHVLSCAPRIPAKLQPLWQQWNERTADMSRMEMSALIISPLPKLGSPTKAPETTEASGAAEGSESESGDDTTDEDALYEASKRSGIQRVKSQQKSKKTTLTSHRKAHNKDENEHGFLRNSDIMVSSGDASSGSST